MVGRIAKSSLALLLWLSLGLLGTSYGSFCSLDCDRPSVSKIFDLVGFTQAPSSVEQYTGTSGLRKLRCQQHSCVTCKVVVEQVKKIFAPHFVHDPSKLTNPLDAAWWHLYEPGVWDRVLKYISWKGATSSQFVSKEVRLFNGFFPEDMPSDADKFEAVDAYGKANAKFMVIKARSLLQSILRDWMAAINRGEPYNCNRLSCMDPQRTCQNMFCCLSSKFADRWPANNDDKLTDKKRCQACVSIIGLVDEDKENGEDMLKVCKKKYGKTRLQRAGLKKYDPRIHNYCLSFVKDVRSEKSSVIDMKSIYGKETICAGLGFCGGMGVLPFQM